MVTQCYLINRIIQALVLTLVIYWIAGYFDNRFAGVQHSNFLILFLAIFLVLVIVDLAADLVARSLKSQGVIIESMDDPVAKLYYGNGFLPPTINAENIYKRLYQLDRKRCKGSNSTLSPCVNMATIGQKYLFDNPEMDVRRLNKEESEGVFISQEPTVQQAMQSGGDFEKLYRCGVADQPVNKTVPFKMNTNEPWLFGSFQTDKPPPYCTKKPYVDKVIKPDDKLYDDQEPKCAMGKRTCLPCDLTEVPIDYAKKLKDRIAYPTQGYQECLKPLTETSNGRLLPCQKQVLAEPNYVKLCTVPPVVVQEVGQ